MPYSFLKDIVQHTFSLGGISLVKITGTDTETLIDSMSEDRSVIIQAKAHNPWPMFIGQFGMPNLDKLNVILNLAEYAEDSKITVTTKQIDGATELSGLHFENKAGDFKNDYRFMSSKLINEQLKQLKFKGVKWNVEFEPSVQNIIRLKAMASANSEEKTFVAKTEKGALKFMFGDHSSHAGDFVFADGLTGTVAKGFHWPIGAVQGILSLSGDKVMRFSDEGAAQITVDSGMALYTYTMPAQQR